MKICYFSSYYAKDYTRTQTILNALKKNKNFEVVECIDNSKSFLRYFKAIYKFLRLKDNFDIVIVGFRGHEILPIIRKLTKKPIIFDAFVSVYDTLCFERKRFKPNSLIGKFLFWFDKYNCRIANKILLDTKTHADYFAETFGINRNKFYYVYIGANEELFYPRKIRENKEFTVFFYGTYRPLQGIEYIIKAAKLLENEKDIVFKIIGGGGGYYTKDYYKKMRRLAKELDVKNIDFIDWIPYEELPLEIAKADICLGGHFSNMPKATRVISGKTFQFIAMKKPTIVGKNEANKELFKNGKNIYMCNMADERSLANAILELKNNVKFKNRIALEAYKSFYNKTNLFDLSKNECLRGIK